MNYSGTSAGCKMNEVPVHINSLPDEIFLNILKYLSLTDLVVSVSDVCTRWKTLSRDRKLWKNKVLELPEDDSVRHIADCFPRYTSVTVDLGQTMGSWAPQAVFGAEHLHVALWSDVCFSSFLQTIVRNGEVLTDISIFYCKNENVEEVLMLISYLPNLQRLKIAGSVFTENTGLRHLADGCPLLTAVDTGDITFTDAELKLFLERKGRQLTQLGLAVQTAEGSLTTRFLHVCCETLTRLDLYGVAGFYQELVDDVTVFGEMKRLEQLHLHRNIKFDEGVLANAFRSGWFDTLQALIIDDTTYIDGEVMTAINLHCPQPCDLQVNTSKFS